MWYASRQGLRFECTGCGGCCRRPGVVEFTPIDIAHISQHLELTQDEFCATYLEQTPGHAWRINVEDDAPCVFLKDDQCSIHDVKPVQCSSYPFWPELLEHRHAWYAESLECEGINRGQRHTPEEIAQKLLKASLE